MVSRKKRKTKKRSAAKKASIEARILIVEFETLPSGIRALVLSRQATDASSVNGAKRRLRIRGDYKVAAAIVTHRRIAEQVYDRLLEALPRFAFGSVHFLVRASVDRIERKFLEVVSAEPAHYEYTLKSIQEESSILRDKLAGVLGENDELKAQIKATQKAMQAKDAEIEEQQFQIDRLERRVVEAQNRSRVSEWRKEDQDETRERERFWDSSRAWPDEDPDPWRG